MKIVNMIIKYWLILLITCSYASEFTLLRHDNFNLLNQIKKNSKPLIINDKFRIAGDLHFWKYLGSKNDQYYHGPGYWLDAFMEYELHKNVIINLKASIFDPSTSFGYDNGQIKPFLGLTFILSPNSEIRLFDLGHQSVGDGLIVDQEQATGFLLKTKYKNKYFINIMFPGTSLLSTDGEIVSTEIYAQSFVQYGSSFILFNSQFKKQLIKINEQILTLFIKNKENSSLIYSSEIGHNLKGISFQFKFGIQKKSDTRFTYQAYFIYKEYHPSFLAAFQNKINYEYFPYELTEIKYNKLKNLYINAGGEIKAYGLNLNFLYNFSNNFLIKSQNELGNINYKIYQNRSFLWNKLSLGYCYNKIRPQNCLYTYFSNKILNTRSANNLNFTLISTTDEDGDNVSYYRTDTNLYKKIEVIGIEGMLHF